MKRDIRSMSTQGGTVQQASPRWKKRERWLQCCGRLFAALAVAGTVVPLRAQSGPTVWIEVTQRKPFADTQTELRIHVGTPGQPVTDLFGLAFEVHYSDSRYLEFAAPSEAAPGTFLQPDIYTFSRHEPDNRVIYLALSRKRGAPGQSGEGIVFTLPLRVAGDAVPGWSACFSVKNVVANDPTGAPLPIEAGDGICLEIGEPGLVIEPNPITPNDDGQNDDVKFKRDGGLPASWIIQIMDRNGRLLRTLTDGQDRWDGRDAHGRLQLPGVYLYTIRDGDRIVTRGLLGIIR